MYVAVYLRLPLANIEQMIAPTSRSKQISTKVGVVVTEMLLYKHGLTRK
jgi:hypothetical protein